MKYVMIAVAAIVGLGVVANMAMVAPPFDYNAASETDRQEWMRAKAVTLNTQAQFFSLSADESSAPEFVMNSVESDVVRREMRMHIDIKLADGAQLGVVPALDLHANLCALSEQTGLQDQGVTLTAIYADQVTGRRMMRGRARPQDCAAAADV